MKQAAMLERPIWQKIEGGLRTTANKKLMAWVQQPLRNEILPTTAGVSLEAGPSLDEPSDEITRNTLIAVLWDTLKQWI